MIQVRFVSSVATFDPVEWTWTVEPFETIADSPETRRHTKGLQRALNDLFDRDAADLSEYDPQPGVSVALEAAELFGGEVVAVDLSALEPNGANDIMEAA